MTAVLMFHDVAPGQEFDAVGFPGDLAARYKIEPDAFDAHLEAILGTGLEVGLISGSEMPSIALTFDDGGASALSTAGKIESLGWRGHFMITTARVGTPGFLDAEGVRELKARGHLVGSHSHSHPTLMGRLGPEEIAEEWRRSNALLEEMLGEAPTLASLPGGYLTPGVVAAAAEAGYRVLFTSEPVSEVKSLGSLRILGRYVIRAKTTPRTTAAYATGAGGARARLSATWAGKRTAKKVNPRLYEGLRALLTRDSRSDAGRAG